MEKERPESIRDLELGKAHLKELLDQLLPLVQMDKEKNVLAFEIKKDIDMVEDALQLKKASAKIQALFDQANNMTVRSREDQDRINQLHRDINLMEKGLL